jgi:hypothetical protein
MFGNMAVLCGVWEKKPPFNPDVVTEEFADILRDYHLTAVTGDRYSAQWVVERFAAHGVKYVASAKTRSEIYSEFLALVNSDRVKIPNNRRLRAQLVSLERRTSRTGKDSVDHPPGAHDDCANAVAGALCLAAAPAKRRFWPIEVIDVRVGRSDFPANDPDPNGDPYDPAVDLPWDNWRRLN